MIKYLTIFSLLIAAYVSAAELPQFVIDGDESFKPGNNLKLPDLKNILFELEYFEKISPDVFEYDLNGDNANEIFIKSNTSLCGNGGCVYILIDGKSKRRIGNFLGAPLVVIQKKNGQNFPDIEAYGHTGAGTGNIETFRYSTGKYKSISSIDLSGKLLEIYLNRIGMVSVKKSR